MREERDLLGLKKFLYSAYRALPGLLGKEKKQIFLEYQKGRGRVEN
jgi:hypothetical protein